MPSCCKCNTVVCSGWRF